MHYRYFLLSVLFICFLILSGGDVLAGTGPPQEAVDAATLQVSGVYKQMKILGRTIAMICAMVGSVKVYNKFQMADPDMYRAIFAWIFACLFCFYFPYFFDLLFR